MNIINIEHIAKVYQVGTEEVHALRDVSLKIDKNEYVAIMGPSGSGKSTLMHILGALDRPTKGVYILDGNNVENLSDDELAKIRNKKIGFVFQSYNLLPRTSALKNVMLPMMYAGISSEKRIANSEKLLREVGLADRIMHLSNQLSGGQQQRVAIARALAMDPSIVLADEPTGNLATAQSEEIMSIFQRLNDEGRTILMITHEPEVAKDAKRIIMLRDGKIVSDKSNKQNRVLLNSKS